MIRFTHRAAVCFAIQHVKRLGEPPWEVIIVMLRRASLEGGEKRKGNFPTIIGASGITNFSLSHSNCLSLSILEKSGWRIFSGRSHIDLFFLPVPHCCVPIDVESDPRASSSSAVVRQCWLISSRASEKRREKECLEKGKRETAD